MNKPYPALCKDCMWSKTPEWASNLKCYHPKVVAHDSWALGSTTGVNEDAAGKNCTEERGKKWFAQCGMKGKLWEQKDGSMKHLNGKLTQTGAYVLGLEARLFKLGAMTQPPCFICGYNGPGYFQPNQHPCAERHHKLYKG